MTIENKEIQYSIGIEDLYLCMMKGTETSSALPTYEDIVYRQTNISDLGISTTSSNFVKWASNKKIIN
ncbi:phage tail protein, partial [Bacillus thuringiensis]|nr:phage tail protein [Bacillus thuringiensis]